MRPQCAHTMGLGFQRGSSTIPHGGHDFTKAPGAILHRGQAFNEAPVRSRMEATTSKRCH